MSGDRRGFGNCWMELGICWVAIRTEQVRMCNLLWGHRFRISKVRRAPSSYPFERCSRGSEKLKRGHRHLQVPSLCHGTSKCHRSAMFYQGLPLTTSSRWNQQGAGNTTCRATGPTDSYFCVNPFEPVVPGKDTSYRMRTFLELDDT